MLDMQPRCQRCHRLVGVGATVAYICADECTWCDDCVNGPLHGTCPRCGGHLTPRPERRRPSARTERDKIVTRLRAGLLRSLL